MASITVRAPARAPYFWPHSIRFIPPLERLRREVAEGEPVPALCGCIVDVRGPGCAAHEAPTIHSLLRLT